MVGIWGMGGIGKTTIAEALYRRLAYKFEGSSFVKDVREKCSNKYDICDIQEKIIKDILLRYSSSIDDPDYGTRMIEWGLSNMKILLVLDDVDDVNQIEYLAETHDWFGPGSRIIITTRNEHLLSHADAKYKPDFLLMDQAVELFSRYAFKRNSPPEEYKELSYRAICYTGYLPLALKVLGSFFHGRHIGVWESALNRLSKAPNVEIFETLKLSFDGLDVSEKKIFLDIACFFKGKDKEYVTRILDSFGFEPVIGISVLIEKSLISVSEEKLDMHDLIQDMGWQIIRDSFSNSRIWQLEEAQIVRSNSELKAIEAIGLRDEEYTVDPYVKKMGFNTNGLGSMKNLRFLHFESIFATPEPTIFPDELRWLCWREYPFLSLPVASMRKLAGIEMVHSDIQFLWKGQKILPSLKFVDFSGSKCLREFPDVSGAPNIERLNLSNCKSLVKVHQSLGYHRRLVYLNMSFCKNLNHLPSFIEMESLETLILSNCLNLEGFPQVSPCMVKLSKIHLDHCRRIEELPSSIRYLSGLTSLNLINCTNLKNVTNSICKLRNLKSIDLYNCKKLQKLPEELGRMENLEELLLGVADDMHYGLRQKSMCFHTLTDLCCLRKLDLSWRHITEEEFPKNLHAFSLLEELHLSGNSSLKQLPAGISHLSSLKLLELNNCKFLKNLHALPSGLQVLKANGCRSLKNIGDFSKENEWLYKIWLFDCHKLLKDQENKQNIDNMVLQSFLKECAAVNHRLSIAIPGCNMLSWFKEECHGCNIALKLPQKCHTQVMGFAVCGVFMGDWVFRDAFPQIIFKIVNDEKYIPKKMVNSSNSSVVSDKGNVWISYTPFDFFQQMYHDIKPEDWSHIEGNLVMTIKTTHGTESVKCGAHIVYKEDLESIQQERKCVADYGNLVLVDGDNSNRRVSGNTYVYEEKSNDKSLNLMGQRTRKRSRIMNRTFKATWLKEVSSRSA